jgi:hypothetical protein
VSAASAPEKSPRKGAAVFRSSGDSCRGPEVFAVSRPEVLEVLVDASAHHWGYVVELAGTREQLLAAGVATPDMFASRGKTGMRTACDEYGNQWTIQRRARGRFKLTLRTFYGDGAEEIDGKYFRSLVGWREHGAAVEAEVAKALELNHRRENKP